MLCPSPEEEAKAAASPGEQSPAFLGGWGSWLSTFLRPIMSECSETFYLFQGHIHRPGTNTPPQTPFLSWNSIENLASHWHLASHTWTQQQKQTCMSSYCAHWAKARYVHPMQTSTLNWARIFLLSDGETKALSSCVICQRVFNEKGTENEFEPQRSDSTDNAFKPVHHSASPQ